MKNRIIVGLAVFSLALTACSDKYLKEAGFQRSNGKQSGTIAFKVQGGGTKLEIDNNPNRKCEKLTTSPKLRRGCFDVKRGDIGEFTFAFKQKADKDDYYFATFQICTWNGGVTIPSRTSNCLSAAKQREFSVTIDGQAYLPNERGIIDLTLNGARELEEFVLFNANIRKENYFYWVDVCPKGQDPGSYGCLTVDPGSRNGGKRRW